MSFEKLVAVSVSNSWRILYFWQRCMVPSKILLAMSCAEGCSVLRNVHFGFVMHDITGSKIHREQSVFTKLTALNIIFVKFHWPVEAAHRAIQFLIFHHITPPSNSYRRDSKSITAGPVDIWTEDIGLMIGRFWLTICLTCKRRSHLDRVVVLHIWLILLIEMIVSTLARFVIFRLIIIEILWSLSDSFHGITTVHGIGLCFVSLIWRFGDGLDDPHDFLIFGISDSWRIIRSYHWLSVFDSDDVWNLRCHHRKLLAFVQTYSWIGTRGLELGGIASEKTVVAWAMVRWFSSKHAVIVQRLNMGRNVVIALHIVAFQTTLVQLIKSVCKLQEFVKVLRFSILIQEFLINYFLWLAS